MKQFLSIALLVGFVFVAQGFAQTQSAQGQTQKTEVFDRYDTSYFIKNNSGLEDNSFLVLTNQDDFDVIFGGAPTMRNKKFLPKDFFDTRIIVATNKKGNFMRKYDVKRVVEKNGKLYVLYNTTDEKLNSGSWHTFLSLAVKRGDYEEIVFVENGKKVAEVPIEE